MNTRLLALLTLVIGMTLATPQRTKACFDTLSIYPSVVVHYDTTFWEDFVVRVSGFTTKALTPGTFCTCAIHDNAPLFDAIQYIAFVDSGTNHRVDGLAEWYAWAPASSGWDSIYQITWEGFLSQVEGNGTIGGRPVELLIRAKFGPGYAYIPMVDDMNAIIGWGSWNNATLRPNNDRWWAAWVRDSTFQFIPVHTPSTFFTNLDQDLIYTAAQDPTEFSGLEVYPLPARDVVNLRMPQPHFAFRSVDIYDLNGRPIIQGLHSPTNELAIDVSALAAGMYFVRFQTPKGTVTKRIVIE